MILFLTEKHISQLICNANQLTGFYMRGTLVFNQVSHDFTKSYRGLWIFYLWFRHGHWKHYHRGVLKNVFFVTFLRKHPSRRSILVKFQTENVQFYSKRTQRDIFFWEFCSRFQNRFFKMWSVTTSMF